MTHIALGVGFDSSQALANALRQRFGQTATAVRHGSACCGAKFNAPRSAAAHFYKEPHHADPDRRYAFRPTSITATARGMENHAMHRATQEGFGRLMQVAGAEGLLGWAHGCVVDYPDNAKAANDPDVRLVAGLIMPQPAPAAPTGLEAATLAGGRNAVFRHTSPLRHPVADLDGHLLRRAAGQRP